MPAARAAGAEQRGGAGPHRERLLGLDRLRRPARVADPARVVTGRLDERRPDGPVAPAGLVPGRVGAGQVVGAGGRRHGERRGEEVVLERAVGPRRAPARAPARRRRSSSGRHGRRCGSGSRPATTTRRTCGGRPERSCSPRRTRSMIAIAGPRPNGGCPVPANATVAAQACTSEAAVASSPKQDLGGQVAGRAEQPAGVGELGVVGDPREPEVDEDGGAALHQHVGRLHVPVQHPLLVHGEQRLAEPGREPDQVGPGDRPLLAHVVVEREARHVAGGDVRDVVPRVGVDDLGDAGVPDPRQRAHLAGQPPPGLVVADDVRAQHLQRDPWPARALGQVDDAHAALADAGEQPVAADRETRRRTWLLRTRRGRHAVECTCEHPARPSLPCRAQARVAADLVRRAG